MNDHAIVVADRSGTIQLWSGGAETLFGYTAAEAVGRTLDLIVPDEFRDQHWNGFRKAMATGSAQYEGQPSDLPVKCRNGQRVFPGLFMLLRDARKNVIGAMAIFTAAEPGSAEAGQ
jgi:PAS domain S-box-containing protein